MVSNTFAPSAPATAGIRSLNFMPVCTSPTRVEPTIYAAVGILAIVWIHVQRRRAPHMETPALDAPKGGRFDALNLSEALQ